MTQCVEGEKNQKHYRFGACREKIIETRNENQKKLSAKHNQFPVEKFRGITSI